MVSLEIHLGNPVPLGIFSSSLQREEFKSCSGLKVQLVSPPSEGVPFTGLAHLCFL